MFSKRVFIALAVGEELISSFLIWKENHPLPVRWTKDKNLHVTLVPPWYENDVDKVVSELQKYKYFGLGEGVFNHISYGPNLLRPRLIWAEGSPDKKLSDLYLSLSKDFALKENNWKMHLTLARFREEEFKSFNQNKLDEAVCWKTDFDALILMESILAPSGAEYNILERIKL